MTRDQKKMYGFVGGSVGVIIVALIGAILSVGGLINKVENLSRINNALAKEFEMIKIVTIRTDERVKNIDYRVRKIERTVNGRKR